MRRVELLLLEGRGAEALALAAGTERVAVATDGGGVVETALIRLHGSALLQVGRSDEAGLALEHALRRARDRDERLEEALVLDAQVYLNERAGVADAELLVARDEAFRELGIVAAPAFASGIAGA